MKRAIWALALLVPAIPALAQRPLGIDVSKWQGTINWPQVYASGRVFASIKASQGTIVIDEKFSTNIVNAPAAGLLVCPYHFADPLNERQPSEPPHTAVDEADWFITVAGNYMAPGYLPPMLDLEKGSSLGRTVLSNWVNDFCNRILQVKGVRPIIYTNYNYAQNYLNSTVTVWDVWIAYWDYGNPQTANPPAGVWPTWTFWQYTVAPAGTVPGISTDIDLDVFHGTMAELEDYVIDPLGEIVVNPGSLSATVRAGLSAEQTFTIAIINGGTRDYGIADDADWLSVSPAAGSSAGESDTIAVSYSTAGLNVRTYSATISVTAFGTTNTPRNLPVTLTVEPVPGDLDADGDIDTADVALFGGCMTGADSPPVAPQCAAVDFDGDLDIDQADYGVLQKCISGPTVDADPHCPD